MEILKKPIQAVERRSPFKLEQKVSKVQDFVPLDYIGKDIVRLTDGSCYAVLKANPTNFFLLSEAEKERKVDQYEEHVRRTRYPFQIFVSADFVNIESNIANLRESQRKARLGHPNEAQLARLGNNELDDVRQAHSENPMMNYDYYILVPADTENAEEKDDETVFTFPYRQNSLSMGVGQSLDIRIKEWQTKFEDMGVPLERLKTGKLLDLYYRTLNPDLSKRQPLPVDVESRLGDRAVPILMNKAKLDSDQRNGHHKADQREISEISKDGKSPLTVEQLLFGPGTRTLLDIAAPARYDVDANTVDLGDTSLRTLKVVGLPEKTRDGWLDQAIGQNQEFLWSFHAKPYEKDDAKYLLDAQLEDFRAQEYRDQVKQHDPDPELAQTIEHHEKLRDQIRDGDRSLVNVDWYVGVKAPKTPLDAALKSRQNAMESMLGQMGVSTREVSDRQLEASLALMPFLRNKLLQGQDVDSGYFASMIPFLTNNIFDEHGVPIGRNMDSKAQIWLDLHADRLPNRTSVIFGAFGMGKSYLGKQLAYLNYLYYGQPFVAIDQGNTTEWFRLVKFLNEQYIYLGPSSTARINPCELPTFSNLAGDSERNPLGRKKQELFLFTKMLMGSINHELLPEDHSPLNKAINDMYEGAGITENRRTHNRRPPLLRHLQEQLADLKDVDGATKARAGILSGYMDYYTKFAYAKMFYDQGNVPLKGSAAFNLREMSDQDRVWGTYLVNRYTWDQAQSELVPRNLIIDEGWKLMQDKEIAENVNQSTREVRRSDIAQVFITQEPSDAKGAGEIIVNTAANVILLGQEEAAMKEIKDIFKLTDEEAKRVRTDEPGRGLIISGGKKAAIKTRINPGIHSLITTKPEEVREVNAEVERIRKHPQLDLSQRPLFELGKGIRVL